MADIYLLIGLTLPPGVAHESIPAAVSLFVSDCWPGMSRTQMVAQARRRGLSLSVRAAVRCTPGSTGLFERHCHVVELMTQKMIEGSGRSEIRRILGEPSEAVPSGKACREQLPIKRGAEQMSLEREVLANRSEARQEGLCAIRIAEATHPALAFTRRLMAIFGAVVHTRTGFDEDVFDVCQFGDFGLRGRITAQLIGDDPSRRVGTGGQHAFEEALRGGLVATFLQQDVEFSTVLIDCAPEQVRLTAQRHENFVKMPCAARFAASRLDAMCEACAKFIAPAANRLVTDHDAALEQQFFNIT
jgi:hypothetical protein